MSPKTDLKRELKRFYSAPADRCEIVDVPELDYLTLEGQGDPSGPEYGAAVGALFGVSYAVKFLGKAAGRDLVVMPLQALWWKESPQ